jgi:uncharacterized membrane protein YsdA (DUF1294 family)
MTLMLAILGINVIAFLAFGWDKFCATKNLWRVAESTLLALAFLGGAGGAIAGQQIFRHKTRKEPFRSQLYLMAGINIVAVVVAVIFDISGMLFEAGKPT